MVIGMTVKRNRLLWLLLFLLVLGVTSSLATGWNLIMIRDAVRESHYTGVILGTLGFLTVFVCAILFFVKIQSEMRINQRQSEFLSHASHQLKTPLSTLELSSELLERGDLAPEERERLWAAHRQELGRLKSEVDHLLQAARAQDGKTIAARELVDLEQWLKRSWERWAAILGEGARLERKGDALPLARLDIRSLDIIVDNLIANARKYSAGAPQVTLRTSALAREWRLDVSDCGQGFDPRLSKRLFKRFFRSPSAPTAEGIGLGLYIARTLGTSMKLRLTADSAGPGRGATFSVSGRREFRRAPEGPA